ncbi:MAG: hypothetical protein LC803_09400 [Acidobacteria bacterium]|nr:hypothetical protein [Acidobacteriota bacterium]
MIKAIRIPPTIDDPLWRVEIDPHDFATYQGITGGNMQTHDLRNPSMTLYSNGVSTTPLNIRATLMLWVHDPESAYHVMIAGQALLTGNDEGADVDVPKEVIELATKAQGYKVEVNGENDGLTYDNLAFAYAAVVYQTAPSKPGGEVKIRIT